MTEAEAATEAAAVAAQTKERRLVMDQAIAPVDVGLQATPAATRTLRPSSVKLSCSYLSGI